MSWFCSRNDTIRYAPKLSSVTSGSVKSEVDGQQVPQEVSAEAKNPVADASARVRSDLRKNRERLGRRTAYFMRGRFRLGRLGG